MRHHSPRTVDERRAARRLDIIWYRPPDGPPPAWWPVSPEPLAYLDEISRADQWTEGE